MLNLFGFKEPRLSANKYFYFLVFKNLVLVSFVIFISDICIIITNIFGVISYLKHFLKKLRHVSTK